MLKLYEKYKSVFWYLVFGGLTTLINIVVYWVCYNVLSVSNTVSNIIAWILSVAFAFVTNKLFVFESRNMTKNKLFFELVSFFLCRLGTGLLDLAMMYVSVDIMKWDSLLMKILANIIVIVLNFVASKLIIFKKGEK